MIYLYDRAICKDLENSFNFGENACPAVRVIDPDSVIDVVAQIQEDAVKFPIVALTRDDNIEIDESRYNYSLAKQGIIAAFDKHSNSWMNEKLIPIKLNYNLTLLTTSYADMDELVRELLFKYTDMYFLSITLPYEVHRGVRFGVKIPKDSPITIDSSSAAYLSEGKLYQCILPLVCDGCFLVSYTPVHLRRQSPDVEVK